MGESSLTTKQNRISIDLKRQNKKKKGEKKINEGARHQQTDKLVIGKEKYQNGCQGRRE